MVFAAVCWKTIAFAVGSRCHAVAESRTVSPHCELERKLNWCNSSDYQKLWRNNAEGLQKGPFKGSCCSWIQISAACSLLNFKSWNIFFQISSSDLNTCPLRALSWSCLAGVEQPRSNGPARAVNLVRNCKCPENMLLAVRLYLSQLMMNPLHDTSWWWWLRCAVMQSIYVHTILFWFPLFSADPRSSTENTKIHEGTSRYTRTAEMDKKG